MCPAFRASSAQPGRVERDAARTHTRWERQSGTRWAGPSICSTFFINFAAVLPPRGLPWSSSGGGKSATVPAPRSPVALRRGRIHVETWAHHRLPARRRYRLYVCVLEHGLSLPILVGRGFPCSRSRPQALSRFRPDHDRRSCLQTSSDAESRNSQDHHRFEYDLPSPVCDPFSLRRSCSTSVAKQSDIPMIS